MLLKEEICDNGLESITKNWIIFESKSPKILRKKLDRGISSKEPNTSSTLLKVRDYLDDDVKAATSNSRVAANRPSSEVMSAMHFAAARSNGTSISCSSGLTVEAEIPRPVAVKPSSLTGQFYRSVVCVLSASCS